MENFFFFFFLAVAVCYLRISPLSSFSICLSRTLVYTLFIFLFYSFSVCDYFLPFFLPNVRLHTTTHKALRYTVPHYFPLPLSHIHTHTETDLTPTTERSHVILSIHRITPQALPLWVWQTETANLTLLLVCSILSVLFIFLFSFF